LEHTVWPVLDVYVPATQFVHGAQPIVEYVPALHCTQADAPAPDCVPVAQLVQVDAPEPEYFPALHVAQPVLWVVDVNVPPAHASQERELAGDHSPTGHA
jgi:hypothetical protein